MSAPSREQITAYLLGELGPVEAAALEARVSADPELADEVETMRRLVTELEAAPPEAWHAQRTLPPLKLPGERAEATPGRRSWAPPRLALAGGLAVAVFAIGLAIGIGVGGDDEPTGPLVSSVGLHALGGDGASGLVSLAEGEPRTAEVVIDGLPRSAAGEHYELWLLGSGDPVSLGTFTVGPDGHADNVITIPVDPGAYRSFDVSVEPDDGDPAHSGDSVLRGPSTSS